MKVALSKPGFELPKFDERPKGYAWAFQGLRGKLLTGYLIVYFLFHIAYSLGWLSRGWFYLSIDHFTPISIAGGMFLAFLLLPLRRGGRKNRVPWYDWLLMAVVLSGCIWVIMNNQIFMQRLPIDSKAMVLGAIFMLAALEGCRRAMGLIITGMLILFFFYAMYADYFPGILWSPGVSFQEMIEACFAHEMGMFGAVARVAAQLMVVFSLFAITIQVSGAGRAIMKISLGLLGHLTGGPAKVAVLGSGIFGSIAPAGPANVMVTGSVTIPMMKKSGQTPHFAASVEAAASILGTLTPPIMGALAFIIAEWLELPFYKVMLATFLPAVFFFFTLYWMVDFQAREKLSAGQIVRFSRDELPSIWEGIREGWIYILPIALFVYLVAALKYSAQASVTYAWFLLVACSFLKKEDRLTWEKWQSIMQITLKLIILIVPMLLSMGIVLASLGVTGSAIRFTGALVDLSGGNLYLLLIMAGDAAFIVGMGMPLLATYFIMGSLIAPALVQGGLSPIAAHLFIVYCMTTHFFTPPVMPGVIFTSAIAEARVWPTAWSTIRLSISLLIVPTVMVFNTCLFLQGDCGIGDIIAPLVPVLIGLVCLSAGIQGWLIARANWMQRLLLLIAGMMLILAFTNHLYGVGGLVLLLLVLLWQGILRKLSDILKKTVKREGDVLKEGAAE